MIVTVAVTVFCLTSLAYAKDKDDKDKETKHVPEINVGMAGSAITVLVGALSLFHERRRKESS
jgi:desulfoferrodoxin (superoxide reductase-like protein)